jgi:tetratricopeptide (TPR) repeat protein
MEYDSKYYYGLGLECFESGDVEKALEHFRKSLEIKPHFKTYERMYQCYKKMNKTYEAKECIEKAFYMNDKNDKVAIEYIRLLIQEGNIILSKKLLNGVLERNPSYDPAKKLLQTIGNH